MGASPSHEDDGDDVAETEDSEDDDDVIKMQHARYRVRIFRIFFFFYSLLNKIKIYKKIKIIQK